MMAEAGAIHLPIKLARAFAPIDHQPSAHNVPKLHPASTSDGQWTPRYTRLAPIAATSSAATAAM